MSTKQYIQEYKVEGRHGPVFFFKHSSKTAYQHAKEYQKKNGGVLYRLSTKPKPFPRWEVVR
jgi:hypothetical protein